MNFKNMVLLVLKWRILITLVSVATILWLPFTPTYPYAEMLVQKYGNRWLTTWSQFDGVHYLTIVDKGYEGTELIQAFFPLYPTIVKVVSLGGLINPVIAAITISTLCLVAAYYLLYRLLLLDEKATVAKNVLWLNLAFVTAFFYSSVYTESVFLLLTVSSFYLARQKRWWWAGILGALAAFTRISGVFLVAALLWEYWQEHKKIKLDIVACLLPILGLGVYMTYLYKVFGDPLLFMHVQSEFGASRETGKLILLYQVFYRYAKMLVTVQVNSWTYYQVVLELGAGVFGTVAAVMSFRWLRHSYAWYALLSFLLPTLTGTFSSLPRYLLVLFPFFVVIARVNSPLFRKVIFWVFLALQILNVVLFTQGKWVA